MEISLETAFEIIIVISTVLFHALSAVVLILMVRVMMNEDKDRISSINKSGGADNPSQQTE